MAAGKTAAAMTTLTNELQAYLTVCLNENSHYPQVMQAWQRLQAANTAFDTAAANWKSKHKLLALITKKADKISAMQVKVRQIMADNDPHKDMTIWN